MNKGAWWVDSPAAVATLAAAGFNLYLIPYLTDTQIDATLAAVPAGQYAVVLLTGATPEASAAQVTRLIGRPFYGYVVCDEPNCGGTLVTPAVQTAYYQWVKAADPFKAVLASYHLDVGGPSFPACVIATPGIAWDVALLNCYPAAWGNTDAQAGALLQGVASAGRAFFPPGAVLVPLQQAAGNLAPLPGGGGARPIPGLLQAQHTIWKAAGLVPNDSICYYGWGTNPETWNLQTPGVLAEAAAVV